MANERVRGNGIGPTGVTVAYNAQRLRATSGMSLREMSARLTEIGRPMSISAISKIENLERRVDVDDLIAMALVLEVNPNALLFPPTGHPEKVVALGEVTAANADEVWKWARGEDTLGSAAAAKAAMSEYLERASGAQAEDRWEIIRSLREAEAMKFRARVSPGSPSEAGPSVFDDPAAGRG